MKADPHYEDYRRVQIEDGVRFQDFVVDVAWQAGLVIAQYASRTYQLTVGESRSGVEIKHDKERKRTGNLYIETAEKARPREGPYVPSGIMREGHWLYAIGDYDIIYFFPNNYLRCLSQLQRYRRVEKPTSQAFLLPEKDGAKYAAFILRPNASEKVDKLVGDLEALARQLHADMMQPPNQLSLFK